MKKELYVFIHLHKTGGTTLKDHLKEHLNKDNLVLLYPNKRNVWLPYSDVKKERYNKNDFRNYFSSLTEDQKNNINVIYGHIGFHNLQKWFPNREIRYMVVLRDPIKRVVSLYNHQFFKVVKTREKNKKKLAEKYHSIENFREFVKEVNPAKKLVQDIKNYFFIGFLENSENDFPKICEYLGVPNMEIKTKNVATKKLSLLGIEKFKLPDNPQLLDELKTYFKEEYQILEEAKIKMKAQ